MTENLEKGDLRFQWAYERMDALSAIRKRFRKELPFKGVRIAMALHVEAKTGVFAYLLKEGGAQVRMASCNPLSSDDSVVESLKVTRGMEVYARKGETESEYYEYLNKTLDLKPNIIIDAECNIDRDYCVMSHNSSNANLN